MAGCFGALDRCVTRPEDTVGEREKKVAALRVAMACTFVALYTGFSSVTPPRAPIMALNQFCIAAVQGAVVVSLLWTRQLPPLRVGLWVVTSAVQVLLGDWFSLSTTESWSVQVLLMDMLLVFEAPAYAPVVIIFLTLLWLAAQGLESAVPYGLWDFPMQYGSRERYEGVLCPEKPASMAIAIFLIRSLVFVGDFRVTRGFSTGLRAERALIAASIHASEIIAVYLSEYDIEQAAEFLNNEAADNLPPRLREAFSILIDNLKNYRPWLPASIMHHQAAAAGESSGSSESDETPPSPGGGGTGWSSRPPAGVRALSAAASGSRPFAPAAARRASSASSGGSTGHGPRLSRVGHLQGPVPAGRSRQKPKLRRHTETHLAGPRAERRAVSVAAVNLRGVLAVVARQSPFTTKVLLERVLGLTAAQASRYGIVDAVAGDRATLSWNSARGCMDHRRQAARCLSSVVEGTASVRESVTSDLEIRTVTLSIGAASSVALCGPFGCNEVRQFAILGVVMNWAHILERLAAHWSLEECALCESSLAASAAPCTTGQSGLSQLMQLSVVARRNRGESCDLGLRGKEDSSLTSPRGLGTAKDSTMSSSDVKTCTRELTLPLPSSTSLEYGTPTTDHCAVLHRVSFSDDQSDITQGTLGTQGTHGAQPSDRMTLVTLSRIGPSGQRLPFGLELSEDLHLVHLIPNSAATSERKTQGCIGMRLLSINGYEATSRKDVVEMCQESDVLSFRFVCASAQQRKRSCAGHDTDQNGPRGPDLLNVLQKLDMLHVAEVLSKAGIERAGDVIDDGRAGMAQAIRSLMSAGLRRQDATVIAKECFSQKRCSFQSDDEYDAASACSAGPNSPYNPNSPRNDSPAASAARIQSRSSPRRRNSGMSLRAVQAAGTDLDADRHSDCCFSVFPERVLHSKLSSTPLSLCILTPRPNAAPAGLDTAATLFLEGRCREAYAALKALKSTQAMCPHGAYLWSRIADALAAGEAHTYTPLTVADACPQEGPADALSSSVLQGSMAEDTRAATAQAIQEERQRQDVAFQSRLAERKGAKRGKHTSTSPKPFRQGGWQSSSPEPAQQGKKQRHAVVVEPAEPATPVTPVTRLTPSPTPGEGVPADDEPAAREHLHDLGEGTRSGGGLAAVDGADGLLGVLAQLNLTRWAAVLRDAGVCAEEDLAAVTSPEDLPAQIPVLARKKLVKHITKSRTDPDLLDALTKLGLAQYQHHLEAVGVFSLSHLVEVVSPDDLPMEMPVIARRRLAGHADSLRKQRLQPEEPAPAPPLPAAPAAAAAEGGAEGSAAADDTAAARVAAEVPAVTPAAEPAAAAAGTPEGRAVVTQLLLDDDDPGGAAVAAAAPRRSETRETGEL